MKVSDRGLAFIAAHEGFVGRGYLDPVGIVTIGYGFTMRSRVFSDWWRTRNARGLRVGDPLSREDANRLLLKLLDEEYAPPVRKTLPGLPQNQFDACVSVVYNLGPRALTWRWAQALKNRQTARAAALLRKTGTTASGRWLPGLARRRKEEARLLETGDYSLAKAPARSADPDVRTVQDMLRRLGHDPGPVDGLLGPRTRAAVRDFQRAHPPLKVDGVPGRATRAVLKRQIEQRITTRAAIPAGIAAASWGLVVAVPWPVVIVAGLAAVLAILIAGVFWRYRGRFRSVFSVSNA
ncbi:MAG: peptidoglycan-binding protein [Roseibium sp.]|nr:peptidoglycan-binding protein [Roseibium sp.]